MFVQRAPLPRFPRRRQLPSSFPRVPLAWVSVHERQREGPLTLRVSELHRRLLELRRRDPFHVPLTVVTHWMAHVWLATPSISEPGQGSTPWPQVYGCRRTHLHSLCSDHRSSDKSPEAAFENPNLPVLTHWRVETTVARSCLVAVALSVRSVLTPSPFVLRCGVHLPLHCHPYVEAEAWSFKQCVRTARAG